MPKSAPKSKPTKKSTDKNKKVKAATSSKKSSKLVMPPAASQNRKNSFAKNKVFWIVFSILSGVALLGILVILIIENRQQDKIASQIESTAAAQTYLYQLTGDSTWLTTDVWSILNSDNQILTAAEPAIESNWKVKFSGWAGGDSQTTLDLSLGTPPVAGVSALALDADLDAFVSRFINDVNQQQWSNLAISVEPSSFPPVSPSTENQENSDEAPVQLFSINFVDWARGWSIRNFTLEDINVYYTMNKDYSMDGRLVLVWTFTNQNTGEKNLIATNAKLVKTNDPLKPYQWVFDMGSFPTPESETEANQPQPN